MATTAAPKLKRRSITKIAIIEAVESGKQKSEVAKMFDILKNKDALQVHAVSKVAPTSKRLRLAAHQDVEEALFIWFKQARSMNVPISGPILKIKANY